MEQTRSFCRDAVDDAPALKKFTEKLTKWGKRTVRRISFAAKAET
jgi:hypothetical protein